MACSVANSAEKGSLPIKQKVVLRDTSADDLLIFFEQQLDSTANYMAAFTAGDPADKDAFIEHWTKNLSDDTIRIKTIVFEKQVAGHVASFVRFGKPEITYWLGREYWGQGIATMALTAFLEELQTRPIYARVVKDNIASMRVLEKCGFRVAGSDKAFANARGCEIEEFILKLA